MNTAGARRVWCWCATSIIVVVSGCSRGPQNIALVDGQVLFNGLPARASLTSQAVSDQGQPVGRPATADTRSDGTFVLQYSEQQPGALLGRNRVTISIFPVEREAGEFDFQQRFRPVKVVRFDREVVATGGNYWNFVLTY